jgi:hypothetical protein
MRRIALIAVILTMWGPPSGGPSGHAAPQSVNTDIDAETLRHYQAARVEAMQIPHSASKVHKVVTLSIGVATRVGDPYVARTASSPPPRCTRRRGWVATGA